jgi:protease-4
VWSGAQAKERGLVDKLGGLDDAIAAAASRAKLGEHYQVRYIEREMTTWERLALSFSDSEAMVRIARWTGFRLPAGMFDGAELRQVAATVESLRGKRYGAFAHCFCELH